MGIKNRLVRAAVALPVARTVGTEIARVAAFHHPARAAGDYLVVVVVLPIISVAVNGHFVAIPKIVGHHFQIFTLGRHSQRQSAHPHAAVVTFAVAVVFVIVGCTARVKTARAQRPAVFVGYGVGASVARVEVPVAVGASRCRVQRVVVVEATEAREQNFFFVGDVVAVFVGINDEVGRATHHYFVANDGNAERSHEVFVLGKNFGFVGFAVVVGVFQNYHAVALSKMQFGVGFVVKLAVIDGLRNPNPPTGINVHVGWIVKQRRFGPKRGFQIVGEVELVGVGGGVGAVFVLDNAGIGKCQKRCSHCRRRPNKVLFHQ